MVEEEDSSFREEWKRKAENVEKDSVAKMQWDSYVACSEFHDLTDSRSVSLGVRRFLSLVEGQDEEFSADPTMGKVMTDVVLRGFGLMKHVESHMGRSEEKERFSEHVRSIRKAVTAGLDRTLGRTLSHPDTLTQSIGNSSLTSNVVSLNKQNTEFLQSSVTSKEDSPLMECATWIALKPKGFRPHKISFNERLCSTTPEIVLPKSIGLLKCAIRAIRSNFGDLGRYTSSTSSYSPVGSTLLLELFAVPDKTKEMRGWTIAECSEGTSALKRQAYPPTAAKSGQVVSPFRVTMPISKELLTFVGDKPRVGCWNEEKQDWEFDGITDVAYDIKNHEVSFSTIRLGELALLQPRDAFSRLHSWKLEPLYPESFMLTMCPSYIPHGTDMESGLVISIKITPDGVNLVEPTEEIPQLRRLRQTLKTSCSVRDLISELTNINRKLDVVKTSLVSEVAYDDIAEIASGFVCKSSNTSSFSVREASSDEIFGAVDLEPSKTSNNEESWFEVRVSSDGLCFSIGTEPSQSSMRSAVLSSKIMAVGEDAKNAMQKPNPSLLKNLSGLLKALRVLDR